MTKGRAANSYNCDASLCIITTKHKGQHTHTHRQQAQIYFEMRSSSAMWLASGVAVHPS